MDAIAAGVGLMKDNERRIMGKKKYMYLWACLLLCGTAASAESLGSANEGIQKNFNRLVTTKQCPGCDLRGAVLTRMDLREADLQGADLSEAKLNLTNLSKANLKNAVLRGAALGGADFAGADLRGVDLTDAQLAGAYLKEALLDKEIIPEKPYEPEELPEALPEVVERPETSTQASTQASPQPPAQELITPEQEQEADAAAPAAEEEVQEEEILPSTVPSADLGDEALRPAETPADDRSAGIEESSAVFASPEPSEKTAQESGEKEKEAVRLSELPESKLPDIEGRTATTVRSKELVPIAEAQVVNADRSDNLNLSNTLPEIVQSEKKSVGLDQIPVIDTAPEQKKSGAEGGEAELSLWDTFTSLFGSDTADKEKTDKAAEKSGAEQQVQAYTVETFEQRRAGVRTLLKKLHKEKRCVACDLAGADLTGEDLEEVDLERADLSGAKLERTDLRAANLKGVNFTDANLKKADLRKADLYLADFTNADLAGAQLHGALIDSTTFTGAVGVQVEAAHE
ncbi:MAG: pentapeptide repeat-containing protein [Candidatus Electrothrix sp. Rat3]|nr:pentapeptide repeat-containing protein [Candidatus Electrothrix rattekaaiensis]